MLDFGASLAMTSIGGDLPLVALQEVGIGGGERRKLPLRRGVFPRDIGEAWIILVSTLCALSSVVFSTSLHKGEGATLLIDVIRFRAL